MPTVGVKGLILMFCFHQM